MNHFSIECDEKRILYNNWWWLAQWWDWEEASKYFPKPNLLQKKGHGHCLVVCCQSDPLQLSESQQNHYIWEVCSANRCDAPKMATPAAGIGQQKGPSSFPWQHLTTHCSTSCFKNWMNWLQSFANSAIFTWPLTNLFNHLQNFMQGECFHKQKEADSTFQEFIKSWSTNFCATGKNKLIFHWQKCVAC